MALKTKALQISMDTYKHNVHPLAEDDGHVSWIEMGYHYISKPTLGKNYQKFWIIRYNSVILQFLNANIMHMNC